HRHLPTFPTRRSSDLGTIQHVSAMQLLDKADIEATHIPYKGGAAAVTDVIGGQIDFTFAPLVEVLGYIQGGRLRALGVTTTDRSDRKSTRLNSSHVKI